MVPLLLILLAFVLVAMLALVWRRPSSDESARAASPLRPAPEVGAVPVYWPSFLIGLVAAGLVHFVMGAPLWISLAIGVAMGLGASILLRFLAHRQVSKLEFQLADGIDLIVLTLRAGGSLPMALAAASREARSPLRTYLNELVQRVRLGERPSAVLADLESRIPLESFRLFSYVLAAHWEGGGSLASTLSSVGRVIRDRVDLARRIQSQAVETQISVLGVLIITYGLALLMWRSYPERVEAFVSTEIGGAAVAGSILLQGIGLFWISRMTRIEV